MKDFKERRPFIEQGEGNIGLHDINQDSHDTINNHTVNQSHTIVYNGEAGREKLVEERKDEYRLFCKRVITSQFIDRELGRRLRDKALSLSLDEATASEIENYVKSTLSSGALSPQDLVTIDFTKDSIKKNRAESMKGKILALSERSDHPEVQYYANMILAADDPRSCIARYERSSFDSYWQMFWVYISYLRQRNRENAEKVMNKLNDNPTMSNADLSNLLSGAGFMVEYFANNGDESYRDMAFNYLKLYSGGGEPLVESFVESLRVLIKQNRPLYFTQNTELNFYFKMFGAKERQTAAPFAQSIAQATTATTATTAVPVQRSTTVTSTTATSSSGGNRTTAGSFSLKKLVYIAAGICALIWLISRISISTDKSDKNAVPTAVVAENNQTAGSPTPTADKSTATTAQKSQPASSAAANTTSAQKQSSTSAASSGSTVQKPAASTPAANQNTTSSTTTTTTPAPAKTTTPTAAPPATTPAAAQPAEAAELTASELLAKGKSALKKFKAEQAASYFQQAASKGSIEANYYLGELYYNGNGVAKNFPTAKRYFEAAANAGMADAQYMMGVMARNGQGMDKDFNVARQWLQRAAAQGHKKAEQMLK